MKHYREMHSQFDDPIGEGEAAAVEAPQTETAPAAAEGQE